MPGSADIRGLSVKLLKAHKLRYIDMRTVKDPLTGTDVIVLKFRRDKETSPKSFFDDLNENGIQYKKLVKDPEATQIVVELWPKGQKREISKARDKARDKARSQKNKGEGTGPKNNLHYVGIPKPEASINVITSLAKEIKEAGLTGESEELLRIAGEQDWDEFNRKMGSVFRKLKLHTRPEVRQIRETVVAAIIKEMGADAELLSGMRGSELGKRITSVMADHLDLILDTHSIADSVLRRVASTTLEPSQVVAKLQGVRRGFLSIAARAKQADELAVEAQALVLANTAHADIQNIAAGDTAVLTKLDDSLVGLVSSRKLDAAYFQLLLTSND